MGVQAVTVGSRVDCMDTTSMWMEFMSFWDLGSERGYMRVHFKDGRLLQSSGVVLRQNTKRSGDSNARQILDRASVEGLNHLW